MEYHFANRVDRMEGSGIRKLLKITTDPKLISFGAGSPAKNLFPIEELKKANDFVYNNQTRSAFQYSRSEGLEPLREWITDRHNRLNQTNYAKENVLITNGSQQFSGKDFFE
jgi:2-aminoadipate transaminase